MFPTLRSDSSHVFNVENWPSAMFPKLKIDLFHVGTQGTRNSILMLHRQWHILKSTFSLRSNTHSLHIVTYKWHIKSRRQNGTKTVLASVDPSFISWSTSLFLNPVSRDSLDEVFVRIFIHFHSRQPKCQSF